MIQDDQTPTPEEKLMYELQDKIDIIYLRNQLLAGPIDEMRKLIDNYDNYGTYIDILNVALYEERAFFILFESLLTKAQDLMQSKRFDYQDPIYNQIINEIIGKINAIRTLPLDIKEQQAKSYIEWQCQVRGTGPIKSNEFCEAMAYDAELLAKMFDKDLGDLNNFYFYSSMNYFTETIPEFFQQNPEIRELTMKKLEELSSKKGFWNFAERAYAREAKENFMKIKKKEE